MTAVGLGQQPKFFTIYTKPISILEISETRKGSPTKIFGTVRQKIFNGKSCYSPPIIQTFSVPEINATVKDPPT